MIPEFYDGEFLPDGDCEATWIEVQERFGYGDTRRRLCEQMSRFIQIARGCGFKTVYLFGSFISGKEQPGDIDLMWVYRGEYGSLRPECQELLNYERMKQRWNWDMFCCSDAPEVVEELLSGWRKNKARTKQRGIIKIDLERFEGLIL
jgi:predicted nucleotidyltransferase